MQASNDEPAARPKSADGRIQITPPGEGGDNGVGVNEPKAEVMSKVKHASPRTATMAFPSRAVPLSKKFLGLDPSADEVDSVVIHDVHWWTNDADVVMLCEQIGFQIDNKDVLFMEHKVNGKSKGQAVINCHSKDNAIKLNNWFHLHTFQGKKIPSALASSALGNPLHPSNQDFPTSRQNVTSRYASRESWYGLPPNRGYTSGGYGAPNTQGMMMGTLPMDPAIAWSSQQPDYQMGNYGSYNQGIHFAGGPVHIAM